MGHLGRALDNGLRPIEASGLLAHLAIYCGWPSAVAALEAYDQVYTARRVDTESLRSAGAQLPVPASEIARAQEATRALVASDANLREVLKKAGCLTRDSRMKERKKPGQPGARKRFQFSKR